MVVTKTERIAIDLPVDVLFAMRAIEQPEEVQKKLKTALAILLFQEQVISLGKATELAEMSRVDFMEILKEHGIAAYEDSERDFERDQQTISDMIIREDSEEFLQTQRHSHAYQEWLSSKNDIYDELFKTEVE